MAVTNLTLRSNNLYRNGEIIQFTEGDMSLIRNQLEITGTLEDEYHTILASDELTKLAYQKYSRFVEDSSKYWWVIADANKIDNPLDLTDWIGVEILIPNILKVLLSLE